MINANNKYAIPKKMWMNEQAIAPITNQSIINALPRMAFSIGYSSKPFSYNSTPFAILSPNCHRFI